MTRTYDPDLLIGIYTGGAVVAREMEASLPDAGRVDVRLQRPGTAIKSRLRIGTVLSRLPRPLANACRWLEVEFREATLRRGDVDYASASARLAKDPALRDAVQSAQRVLVVDDTVDSGRTLGTVRKAVMMIGPDLDVRTAVLASTWRRPPHRPDFCLYDRTLLRLPWSMDVAA
jgi:hypoxanthine phosphoribosyltransferase